MKSGKEGCGCVCDKPAPKFPEQVTGMYILARSLKMMGVENVYGLVGIPITEAAYIIQGEGIRFVGFRHEQQAGMAAATDGYVSGKPGVFMTVSSLGFMNGLTATANATVNCYPVVQISGSSVREPIDLEQGTYEGLDQLNVAKPVVKAAYRVLKAEDIPTGVVRAFRAAASGRPGGVYLDITTPALGEIVDRDKAEALLKDVPVDIAPAMLPAPEVVERAAKLLAGARKPAFLLGKGAAYARVEDLVKELVDKTGIPYYPMSMAKGLLPDNGPLSALSVRSTIMEQSDVVVLIGARLNWLLSRGHGKWNPDGQFVQLDIDPQEIDCNRHIAAPVVGDLRSSLRALIDKLPAKEGLSMDPAWVPGLQKESAEKNAKFAERLAPQTVPMNHWSALSAAKKVLEANPDVILVNEGANTLDDCRDSIDMFLPRHRIDCATWAIMGMSMGSAVGAAVATGKSVCAIVGDSAFGFSGMDFSTICRFRLPVTVCVFNNGGIYNGIGEPLDKTSDPAPTTLDVNARYDKLGEAFGARTYYVTTPAEYEAALKEAIESKAPALIDVQLAADAGKESGHIGYLNPAPLIDIKV